MRREQQQGVMGALLLLAALMATVGDAAARPCSCWYGSLTDASTCACTCETGYLLPYCAYQAGDNVTVQVVYNAQNNSDFVGEQAESQIRSRYTALGGSVSFMTFDDTDNTFRNYYDGDVVALFRISATVASAFLNDVRAQAAWLNQPTGKQLPILDADVLDKTTAPLSDLAGSTLYNGSMFAIHSQDVVFLVMVVVLIIALVLECVCVQNKEDTVADKQRAALEACRVASVAALQVSGGADSPRPGDSSASSPKAQPESVVLVLNPMMTGPATAL